MFVHRDAARGSADTADVKRQVVEIRNATGAMHEFLRSFGDDLRFVFITSQARLVGHEPADAAPTSLEGVNIKVHASPHSKCERCWHYRADVGSSAEHPQLCGRCVANLYGPGEPRAHA